MFGDYINAIRWLNYSLYAVPPERFGLYKIGTKTHKRTNKK